MTTIGTIYIACGILYIIACVMDGQDVKPLWKKWVGRNLEKAANYFFPIKYVTETKFIPLTPTTPWERSNYDCTTFEAKKIQCALKINESELIDVMLYGRNGVDVEYMIARRKKDCMSRIFDTIRHENLINFEVERTTDAPNILIRAWLYVGKKK